MLQFPFPGGSHGFWLHYSKHQCRGPEGPKGKWILDSGPSSAGEREGLGVSTQKLELPRSHHECASSWQESDSTGQENLYPPPSGSIQPPWQASAGSWKHWAQPGTQALTQSLKLLPIPSSWNPGCLSCAFTSASVSPESCKLPDHAKCP